MSRYESILFGPPERVNPVLRGLVVEALRLAEETRPARPVRVVRSEDMRRAVIWLRLQLEAARTAWDALDCFEAATAEEAGTVNEEVFYPVAVAALRSAYSFGRQLSWTNAQFLEVVCERAFWGQDGSRRGRPVYADLRGPRDPDWHRRHEPVVRQMLEEVGSAEGVSAYGWKRVVSSFVRPAAKVRAEQTGFERQRRVRRAGPFKNYFSWSIRIYIRAEIEDIGRASC